MYNLRSFEKQNKPSKIHGNNLNTLYEWQILGNSDNKILDSRYINLEKKIIEKESLKRKI